MSKAVAELMTAKEAVLERVKEEEWLTSVGIGLVDRRPGLVLSVRRRATAKAERLLKEEQLDVPCRIREVGPIRARPKK